jgi:hygromycin-B 7''-O-kinase
MYKLLELDETLFEKHHKDYLFWNLKVWDICRQLKRKYKQITKFDTGSVIVYQLGESDILKIYPYYDFDIYEVEKNVLSFLNQQELSVEVPELIETGEHEGCPFILMSKVKGQLLSEVQDQLSEDELTKVSINMAEIMNEFHNLDISNLNLNNEWEKYIENQISSLEDKHKGFGLSEVLLNQIDNYFNRDLIDTKSVSLLTGEWTPFNVLVNDQYEIISVIDFGDCFIGNATYDLLGPPIFTFKNNKKDFFLSYGIKEVELNSFHEKKLMTYLLIHRYSNLNWFMDMNNVSDVDTFEEMAKVFYGI